MTDPSLAVRQLVAGLPDPLVELRFWRGWRPPRIPAWALFLFLILAGVTLAENFDRLLEVLIHGT
jgi:hypothetical protein